MTMDWPTVGEANALSVRWLIRMMDDTYMYGFKYELCFSYITYC